MVTKVKWSDEAKNDLKEITSYLKQASPSYAMIFLEKIDLVLKNLLNFPKVGRVVPEYSDVTLREVFIWNYRLVYKNLSRYIGIISITHQKQILTSKKLKWVFS